jgi:hypothetical protein
MRGQESSSRWSDVTRLGGAHPNLRRCRAVGLAGSLILAAGATSAGALPVIDPLAGLPVVEQLRSAPRLGLVLAYFGLTLLVGAWLRLADPVRTGRASIGQLSRIFMEWSLPLAIVPPLYSRDVYSYVVQGAMYRDGLDPYRVGAAAYGGDLAANVSAYWQNSTAPYGPVFLAVAAAVMTVAGAHVLLGVLGMRLVMLGSVVAMLRFLPPLARRHGVDGACAVWLGVLNPLVLLHAVSGAHNDALMVALLLGAMLLAAADRPISAVVVISIAVLIKASALLALVFVIPAAGRRLRGRWPLVRGAMLVTTVAAVTMSAITAAMNAWYGWISALGDTTRVHNGLSLSTDLGLFVSWLSSGARWHQIVDPVTLIRALALILAAGLILSILVHNRGRPGYGLGLALSAIVLLGPVVHPWYLLWGFVPLAATARNARIVGAVAIASAAMAFYPMPSGGGPTPDLALGIIGVFAGVLLQAVWWRAGHHQVGGPDAEPATSPPATQVVSPKQPEHA